jgi:hypothetical protein
MFQFPGLLGYSRLDARWAAPPDFSQPSTPDLLMTPRHPPRALRSLTTPIGPPLLLPIQVNLNHQKTLGSINESFHRGPGKSSPASRDAVTGSEPLMLSVRVHLTRPARLTSSETVCYCTVVEIATHPIVRVIEANRVKPDPLPPHAGVCFVCDQHRIAKKLRLKPQRRREGGPRFKSFLVWPGGEAVKSRPRPAVSVVGRLH